MGFFNKKIFNSRNNAFGIDISDLSVKVVRVQEDGQRKKVVSFAVAPIAPGSIAEGEIVNRENVVLAIRSALEKAGPKRIKNRKVICALPETKAFLRIVSVPKMGEAELTEAIKWEIEANIPLTIDQVYYDWKVLEGKFGQEDGKVSVLVVAVAQKIADQFVEAIEAAGLQVVGLEVESVAQSRSLIENKKDAATTLIVDLGDRRTSFLMLSGSIPCFTSSIPLSCQSMTDAISKALNASSEEAEKIKIQQGIGSFVKRDPIFLAVEPILENLVLEIEKSIDFYLSCLKYSAAVDKIIICGGGANAKGLIPFLSSRLKREVLMGNPWANFPLKNGLPIIEKTESVRYSTAIGLGIRGIEGGEGEEYLNLLSGEKKKELKRKKILKTIIAQEAYCSFVLFLFIVILGTIKMVLGIQLDSLEKSVSTGQSQEKYQELKIYEDKFRQVNNKVAAIFPIQAAHLQWSRVLRELSRVVPENVYLSGLTSKDFKISVAGKAKKREDFLQFQEILSQSTCFQNVDAPLSNLVEKEDVDFQIDFEVKEDCLKGK